MVIDRGFPSKRACSFFKVNENFAFKTYVEFFCYSLNDVNQMLLVLSAR